MRYMEGMHCQTFYIKSKSTFQSGIFILKVIQFHFPSFCIELKNEVSKFLPHLGSLLTIVLVAGLRRRKHGWRGCRVHWRGARSAETPRITLTYYVLQITPAEEVTYHYMFCLQAFCFTAYSYAYTIFK